MGGRAGDLHAAHHQGHGLAAGRELGHLECTGAADPSNPAAVKELNQAEAQLGGVLGRLFALSEAYPDLKANQNMLELQEELTSTENKIGFARQTFNDAVAAYNNRREVFPAVMVAGMLGFTKAALLEAAGAEREAPKASFK